MDGKVRRLQTINVSYSCLDPWRFEMKEIESGSVQLPILFRDHMMIQRDKAARICGRTSDHVKTLCAEFIWNGESERKTCVLSEGRFEYELPPVSAGGEGELHFYVNGGDVPALSVKDITAGDIWLAAGQSNMEYFLRYDAHWNDIRRESFNGKIRMFNVPRIAFEGQKRKLPGDGYWFFQGDPAWPLFSAPGYSFAQELQEKTKIPIGVIGCNWGGTPACAWMKESYLDKDPLNIWIRDYRNAVKEWDMRELEEYSLKCWEFEDSYRHALEWRTMMYGQTREDQQEWMKEHEEDPVLPLGPYHHYRPSGLYHMMLEKAAPFPIKGILWYQGESDEAHAEIYDQTMAALVQCFRDTWNDPNLPFLFVQLAPFEKWLDCSGDRYPELRRRQEMASKTIPDAWMTCVSDLGDRDDIHPKFKREVGQRLALLARGKVYGEKILCEPPECQEAVSDGRYIRLHFKNAEGGLFVGANAADPFRLMVSGISIPVKGIHAEGGDLVVEADIGELMPETGKCTISFAELPYCEVQIWNQAGLPVKPFCMEVSL